MDTNNPRGKKIKTCPVCNGTFECKHSADCWCIDIKISEKNIKALREKFTDCLCPVCLKSYSDNK